MKTITIQHAVECGWETSCSLKRGFAKNEVAANQRRDAYLAQGYTDVVVNPVYRIDNIELNIPKQLDAEMLEKLKHNSGLPELKDEDYQIIYKAIIDLIFE